ncbi:hypothetical protein G6F68_011151 [Rhizopus microsporus]|nr:hypothetical protein G6F68_011151 [Rhizopus microsporus]
MWSGSRSARVLRRGRPEDPHPGPHHGSPRGHLPGSGHAVLVLPGAGPAGPGHTDGGRPRRGGGVGASGGLRGGGGRRPAARGGRNLRGRPFGAAAPLPEGVVGEAGPVTVEALPPSTVNAAPDTPPSPAADDATMLADRDYPLLADADLYAWTAAGGPLPVDESQSRPNRPEPASATLETTAADESDPVRQRAAGPAAVAVRRTADLECAPACAGARR